MSIAASQWGTIVVDEAIVFHEPDFDAEMISQVRRGEIFPMSVRPQGPFYKIKLKDGRLGWVMDVDIKAGRLKQDTINIKLLEKNSKDQASLTDKLKATPRVHFAGQRWRGLQYELIQFSEKTLGKKRSDSLGFVGLRIAGPNTLFEGDTFVTTDLLFYTTAPKYYEQATGEKADGWIMLTQVLFQTVNPQGSSTYSMFGFGPLVKYSHFNLGLDRSGKSYQYAVDDMYLGFVFQGGVAARFNQGFSARLDAKYYYEKQQYLSLGLSVLGQF